MGTRAVRHVLVLASLLPTLGTASRGGTGHLRRREGPKTRSPGGGGPTSTTLFTDDDDGSRQRPPKLDYGLVVDAGSSGSRLRVFAWPAPAGTTTPAQRGADNNNNDPPVITQVDLSAYDEARFETEPGLSAYAATPSAAGASLAGLVDAAQRVVPETQWAETPLYVLATAGMRLLSDAEADPVLDDVRAYLQAESPFDLADVRVISGEAEALFAFVSLNANLAAAPADENGGGLPGTDPPVVVSGSASSKKKPPNKSVYPAVTKHWFSRPATVGALDLGGASTQMFFEPESPSSSIRDGDFEYYANDTRRAAYARSFLGFGQNVAAQRLDDALVRATLSTSAAAASSPVVESGGLAAEHDASNNASATSSSVAVVVVVVEHPCLHRGYEAPYAGDAGSASSSSTRIVLRGVSNGTACAALVDEVLETSSKYCAVAPCGPNGVYVMPPPDATDFYAISAYFYAANGVGLVGWAETRAIRPDDLLAAALAFCDLDRDHALEASGAPAQYAARVCFAAVYAARLLFALGFSGASERIFFTRKIAGADADWTLGAMYYETQLLPLHASALCRGASSGQSPPPSSSSRWSSTSSRHHSGHRRPFGTEALLPAPSDDVSKDELRLLVRRYQLIALVSFTVAGILSVIAAGWAWSAVASSSSSSSSSGVGPPPSYKSRKTNLLASTETSTAAGGRKVVVPEEGDPAAKGAKQGGLAGSRSSSASRLVGGFIGGVR